MGVWFPTVTLSADEHVAYQAAGNLFSGRRQVGVLVTVTNQRLVIVPNRLDGLVGGKRTDLALDPVTDARVEPADTPTARLRGQSARFRPQVEIRSDDQLWALTVSDSDLLANALRT